MLRHQFVFPLLTLLAVGLFGCNANDSATAPSTPDGGEAGSVTGSVDTQDPEIAAALAELSPSDRALADKQKICPVSGEPLGSMGKPIKVSVEGRDILVCCEGCGEPIRENPDKYFAKVEAAGGTTK